MVRTGKFLGAILIGDNQASKNFLAQKKKTAEVMGVDFRIFELAKNISEENLELEIKKLVRDKRCGGLIIQLPLPNKLNQHLIRQKILNLIPARKDPDMLSGAKQDLIIPPPAGVVREILLKQQINAKKLAKLTVAIIGRGLLIGRPVETWFKGRAGKLLIFDSKNLDFKAQLRQADIVISGTGQVGLFGPENLKSGALVIDFGYGRDKAGRIAGDFDSRNSEKISEKNITYTPTPGGTGPILVVKLLENFLSLNTYPQLKSRRLLAGLLQFDR